MKTIDLHTAVATIQEVVRDAQARYGKHVKYTDITKSTGDDGCRYFNPQGGDPMCIVGQGLAKWGLTISDMCVGESAYPVYNVGATIVPVATRLRHIGKLDLSKDAVLFLAEVQNQQDDGAEWHEAVQTTLREMRYRPPVDGDIGEPMREVELEPFPATEPVHEPAAPTPAPQPEPVPA